MRSACAALPGFRPAALCGDGSEEPRLARLDVVLLHVKCAKLVVGEAVKDLEGKAQAALHRRLSFFRPRTERRLDSFCWYL
jgi:hypothetical protein